MKKLLQKTLTLFLAFAVAFTFMPLADIGNSNAWAADSIPFSARSLNSTNVGNRILDANIVLTKDAYKDYFGKYCDVYTITVPDDTVRVELDFGNERLTYNYTKNAVYISGDYQYTHINGDGKADNEEYIEGENLYKCSESSIVDIDSNKDGVLDYIQVQKPYTFINDESVFYSTGGEIEYAVTFKYEKKSQNEFSNKEGSKLSLLCKDFVQHCDRDKKLEFFCPKLDEEWKVSETPEVTEGNYNQLTEYSMLGNTWYSGNELEAQKGETAESLLNKYKYLSACISLISGTALKDYKVTWYYSDKYNANGGYENCVEVPTGEPYVKGGDYEQQTKGKSGEITYQNTKMESDVYGNYYNFQITPDTSAYGTYYYYVVIEYDEGRNHHILSSVNSQAVVKIVDSDNGNTKNPTYNILSNILPNVLPVILSVITSQSILTSNSATFTLQNYGSFPGFTTTVNVNAGDTVADVVKTALILRGYVPVFSSANYMSGLRYPSGQTLSEFDGGSKSGWMYLVNGTAPNVSMNAYILSGNEKITLYYTGDYTQDYNATNSMSNVGLLAGGTTLASTVASLITKATKNNNTNQNVTKSLEQTIEEKVSEEVKKALDKKAEEEKIAAKVSEEVEKALNKKVEEEKAAEAKAAESKNGEVLSGNDKLIDGVKNTTLKAKSKLVVTDSGKKAVQLSWEKSKGYKVDYYEVYRSTNKAKGFKKIYTTKSGKINVYENSGNLKKGTKYYYVVRGVRKINGLEYYTQWSNKAVRTVK